MTSDEALLLQAVAADPLSDDIRLIYADWLEEHGRGDEAEVVRVGLSLARGEKVEGLELWLQWKATNGRFPGLEGLELPSLPDGVFVLSDGLCASWKATYSWSGKEYPMAMLMLWKRGLLSSCHCTLPWWFQNGPQVVGITPPPEVVISDARIGISLDRLTGSTREYYWFLEEPGRPGWDRAGAVPEEIFSLLPRSPRQMGLATAYGQPALVYLDAEEAFRAIQQACVEWAIAQARKLRSENS